MRGDVSVEVVNKCLIARSVRKGGLEKGDVQRVVIHCGLGQDVFLGLVHEPRRLDDGEERFHRIAVVSSPVLLIRGDNGFAGDQPTPQFGEPVPFYYTSSISCSSGWYQGRPAIRGFIEDVQEDGAPEHLVRGRDQSVGRSTCLAVSTDMTGQ